MHDDRYCIYLSALTNAFIHIIVEEVFLNLEAETTLNEGEHLEVCVTVTDRKMRRIDLIFGIMEHDSNGKICYHLF